jgi:hypothetical protein
MGRKCQGPFLFIWLTVLMLGQTAIPAVAEQLNLTMYASGHGTVEPGTQAVAAGSPVTIRAVPDAGYVFSYWWGSGAGSYYGSSPEVTIHPTGAVTQIAYFVEAPYTLTMRHTTGGWVTPETQQASYGSQVEIVAYPDEGWEFAGWIGTGPGAYTGSSATAFATMYGDIEQQAVFQISPDLGYSFSISASATDPYQNTAPPANGYRNLYLWATCAKSGISAIEADVVSDMTMGVFSGMDGVQNLSTSRDILCAVPGCPRGDEVNFLVGTWSVQDYGGSVCLTPSAWNSWLLATDCTTPNPYGFAIEVTGFSSSGEAPCVAGENGCVFDSEPPTAIALSGLTAAARSRRVEVEWSTSVETNHYGFFVYRSESMDGRYELVSDGLMRGRSPYRFVDEHVSGGRTYFYKIGAVEFSGREDLYGPVAITVPDWAPLGIALANPRPNPFRGESEIAFSLGTPQAVTIAIYDVRGRRVRAFDATEFPAGEHRVVWDGRDDGGTSVTAGVYLSRLESEGFTATKKIVFLGQD